MTARAEKLQNALLRLDELTGKLRRDCPWDREQTELSIVPHTVEEAYELADAATSGDDRRLLDELGDVLFQVYFLALLLEERGAGDLAEVADHCHRKLVRRHPHVFGDAQASTPGEVRRNWEQVKRAERGIDRGGHGPPAANLPAPLYAKKVQRRAANLADSDFDPQTQVRAVRPSLERLRAATQQSERFAAAGQLLFACVAASVEAGVDPELALRAASEQFDATLKTTEEPSDSD